MPMLILFTENFDVIAEVRNQTNVCFQNKSFGNYIIIYVREHDLSGIYHSGKNPFGRLIFGKVIIREVFRENDHSGKRFRENDR